MISRVEWTDLLVAPFSEGGDDPINGIDCWGLAREVARRAGLSFPSKPGEDRFQYLGERWTALGMVGDLLVSDPTKKGHASHVGTVVDVERAMVLTCFRAGAVCWPAHRVACTHGVWRLRT